ncbi:MAG TPA: class D sortase [Rubrobacter sp.]|nr:class D sortase [Rubrobacter sp.]
MNRRSIQRSRAITALLLFVLLLAPACESVLGGGDEAANPGASVSGEKRERIEKAAKGQLDPQETTNAETTNAETTNAESTSAESTSAGSQGPKNVQASEDRAPEAPAVHRATEENSRGDYTYLSDPEIDGDPDAVVFATPTGSYDYNIGVWYEPEQQQWAIFNQDRAPVPAGSTFKVTVPPDSEKFVHTASEENVSGDTTYVDDPLVNGKPEAEISVTQNWNPGGGEGVYNDHPVGVRYDADRERWAIYNTDRAEIPEGASFNVTISEQATRTGGDVASIETGEAPEYRDFYSDGDPKTPDKFVSSDSSAGAIPVVKPFNFGRDPGGPEDKTLSLDIPKIGVQDIPVFDTVSEEKLRDGTVHIPATGYPWQDGANVFIAGHRIGFQGTPSYYVFFRLDELQEGDEIRLQDAAGDEYLYRVTKRTVVGPNDVEVMNAVEGKSLITLQTCTLPDYEDRLIVQGELVEGQA